MSRTKAAVAIRPGTRNDAAAVARIHLESWRATYREELPAEYLAGLDLTSRTVIWGQRIGLPGVRILIAGRGPVAMGFAAFGPSRDPDLNPADWSQLYNFHVLPKHRSQGIGARLWRAMLDEIRPTGAVGLTLWVVPTNQGARRFYERMGLRPDGREQTEQLAPGVHLPELRYRQTLKELPP